MKNRDRHCFFLGYSLVGGVLPVALMALAIETVSVSIFGQVMTGPGGFELSRSRAESGGSKTGGAFEASLTQIPWMAGAFPLVGGPLDLQSGFYSFLNFSRLVANTIQTPSGSAQVLIPANAVTEDYLLTFNVDPVNSPLLVTPADISEANRKLSLIQPGGRSVSVPDGIVELLLTRDTGQVISSNFSSPAQLTLRYNTMANSSLVAGTNPPVREQTLSAWMLDEAHQLWVKIPNAALDTGANTMTLPLNHFSVYGLFGTADTVVANVHAFPVPFDPFGPNAGIGAGKTGTEACGVIFNNVPSMGTIKIYTISGELVRSLEIPAALPQCPAACTPACVGSQLGWDVKAADGKPVASGVYIWRAVSGDNSKTGKLMVIR